jgi:uncharacterized membrane protein (UPF0136 family)
MKFMPWLVLLYAFILLGGGMMGFYTSHSWPSLIAGSLSAIVLIVSAISLFNNGLLGYFLAVGLSFIFSIFFTNRFIDTFKIMPAGLMAIISMIVFILLVAAKLKS